MHYTEEERNQIAKENMALINYVISKMNVLYNHEELFQEGMIGLVKGIKNFDKTKDVALSTFLTTCIRNEILIYIKHENMVKRKGYVISLNTVIDEKNGTEYGDMLGEDPKYDEQLIEDEAINIALRRVSFLKDKWQLVFKLSYGLEGFPKLSQKKISEIVGFSQNHVCSILKKINRMLIYELREYK